MSEPSRFVNNLLVLYKHHSEHQLSNEDRADRLSLEFKSTILSALFCPSFHEQRFGVIKKPLIPRLSKLNRLDLLTLYIENCHPSVTPNFLRPVHQFVFFSYIFGTGTEECLHFVADLLIGELFYGREMLWLIRQMSKTLTAPASDDLANAVCAAADKILKTSIARPSSRQPVI
jgi:hypothetical protein